MKRFFLITVLIASCLSASAEGYGIKASFGAVPGMAGFAKREFVLTRPQTLYGIYGDLYVFDRCSALYTVGIDKRLSNRWQAGLSVSTANASGYQRTANAVNILRKKRIHDYALMVNAIYDYFDGGDFRVYGGFAVGLGLRHFNIASDTHNSTITEYDICPLGMRIEWSHMNLFVEGAIGSLMNGCRIGVSINL